MAIEAKVPILPVALSGTKDCMPKGSAWLGESHARARVLAPISTEGLTLADIPRIREEARATIQQAVIGLRAELAARPSTPPPAR
jgi:1-acyl-sn-glycerol-3-phosphate acyltransferase